MSRPTPACSAVKMLVWNIQQGGGPRQQRIADRIVAHNADIVALIEYVPTPAPDSLLQSLCSVGFKHWICSVRDGFNYAVCVLAKTPIYTRPSGNLLLDQSGLFLEITVPGHGFRFGVVHVPTKPRTRMKEFLTALVQLAASNRVHPFLFVGDFNTGIGPADGPMNNFGDVDRFAALLDNGFTDAWRHVHRERVEHTWCRNGKSYRIDHALASEILLPRIKGCCYSHEERERGVSDHSVLLVEIAD